MVEQPSFANGSEHTRTPVHAEPGDTDRRAQPYETDMPG